MADHKKPVILCRACKFNEWVLGAGTMKLSEECFYPDNSNKYPRATECAEYEHKEAEE